jgi:acyl carrier protein
MTDEESLVLVTEIVRDVLDNDDIVLSNASTAASTPGWDSIAHTGIVIALERKLGRSLTTQQIEGIATVGDLVKLVQLLAADNPARFS